MDISISKILGEGALPPELLSSLQEAFDKKVEEVRQHTETSVREEFARRYEHDKENLVEAIDRMLTDVVQKHEGEKKAAVGKFVEARTAFRKAVKEARKTYSKKLDEQVTVSKAAVSSKLKEEVIKLREAKKALASERMGYADKLTQIKEALAIDHAKRIKKIDEFVVRQVEKELKEFLEDHKALVRTRAKLVSESRNKLRETQSRFVKEAAIKVERVINDTLKHEMTQLHEDLEKNRQNMFGRRIFEAVAAEFMTSYLAEGTEIRKLQTRLEEKDQALNTANKKLDEAVKSSQVATRKLTIAEDRATRTKVLSELLTPLKGEKRTVMEGMLETVKTTALRESFKKLLPVVLDESTRRPTNKTVLNEKRVESKSVVTGGQRNNRIMEAVEADVTAALDDDMSNILRLAGITK